MRNRASSILLTLALATGPAAGADDGRHAAPNSSQTAAQSAIAAVDTRTALDDLDRIAIAGRNEVLLERIAWLEGRADWPAPAREYTLFSFTQSLADLPPGTVSPEVLQRLAAIRPEVRVPHPDDDRVGVVLFNIPAAARGTETQWKRKDAAHAASQALARGADNWIAGYCAGDAITRDGYLVSLNGLQAKQMADLADAVQPRLAERAELAVVLARIGVGLADEDRFASALTTGPMPGLAQFARSAATVFDTRQMLQTLNRLEASAPASTTSVVLAEFAAELMKSPAGAQRLFDLVEHESLGLTAAIALARYGDDVIRRHLATIAEVGESSASRHAAIALSEFRRPGAEP